MQLQLHSPVWLRALKTITDERRVAGRQTCWPCLHSWKAKRFSSCDKPSPVFLQEWRCVVFRGTHLSGSKGSYPPGDERHSSSLKTLLTGLGVQSLRDPWTSICRLTSSPTGSNMEDSRWHDIIRPRRFTWRDDHLYLSTSNPLLKNRSIPLSSASLWVFLTSKTPVNISWWDETRFLMGFYPPHLFLKTLMPQTSH